MDRIAPVGSAAAARPLPLFGDGGLSIGQIVHARVSKVDGGTVQLRWGDQTVSVASKVPLTLGQQVSLVVEEGSPGKLVLRMMDEIFGQGRTTRPESSGTGRGTASASTGTAGTTPGGRQLPVTGVQGRQERQPGGSPGGQAFGGDESEWGGPGGQKGRMAGGPAQARPNSMSTPTGDPRAGGFGMGGPGVGLSGGGVGPGGMGAGPGGTGVGAPQAGNGTASTGTGQAGAGFGTSGLGTPSPGAGQTASDMGPMRFGTGQTGPGPGSASPGAGQPGSGFGTGGPAVGSNGPLPGQFAANLGAAESSVNGLWRAGANASRLGQADGGMNGPGQPGPSPAQPGPSGFSGAPRGAGTATGGTWTPGTPTAAAGGSWTQAAPASGNAWTQSTPASGDGWVQGAPGTGSTQTQETASTSTWVPGRPGQPPSAAQQDPLASVLFEQLDGSPVRPGGAGRLRTSQLFTGSSTPRFASTPRTPVEPTPPGHEFVARAAMPAYGRLAQSVGGSVAFGQLMAALPQEVSQTFARAPLSPADLGRLLIDIGVHPDEMNAVLVGELLTQGVPIQEGGIRALRRELAAAGGTPRDAAPAVALMRLGLPVTPLSLAVARQMLAGQLDPPAAWGELLPELQRLARFAGQGSQAGAVAAELLSAWQVPVSDGPEAVSQWLRASIEQTGTPLEAKLVHPPLTNDADPSAAASPGQDVRARLDLLSQSLPESVRDNRSEFGQSLQRLQATVQAEQLLNGSQVDRTEPRFFAVTLPTVFHEHTSTLQIRVRERDARPRAPGEAARPDIVHLKLSLPGLGDLGVNLTVGQHSVACHFAAGTSFAEALLNASSSELVGRLKQLGYAHTAVDAAHEAPEPVHSPLAVAPRVSHVDLQA